MPMPSSHAPPAGAAQQAGARWDPARKLWRMDRRAAEALGWHRLIVAS